MPKHVQKQTKIIVRFPAPLQLLRTSAPASVTTCVNFLRSGRRDKYFELIVLTTS